MSEVPGPPAEERRASDEPRPSAEEGRDVDGRGIPWKIVIWGVVAAYAVLFLLLNNEKQSVSFVFFTVKTRLIWLILLSMALGAALATIGPRWWRSRKR
jgi:uncharacterized integral membrane protein